MCLPVGSRRGTPSFPLFAQDTRSEAEERPPRFPMLGAPRRRPRGRDGEMEFPLVGFDVAVLFRLIFLFLKRLFLVTTSASQGFNED